MCVCFFLQYRLKILDASTLDTSRQVISETIAEFFVLTTKPSNHSLTHLARQFSELLGDSKLVGENAINEVCKAIVFICVDDGPCIKALIDSGVKTCLMKLLTHQSEIVVASALRALRCLVLPKITPSWEQVPSTTEAITVRSPSPSHRGINQEPHHNHHFEALKYSEFEVSKDTEGKDWLVSPLLAPMQRQGYVNLCELDFITCHNVEMFRATSEDADDREKDAGAAIVGQVGIRCIHCGVSPFARTQFSTVYPGE